MSQSHLLPQLQGCLMEPEDLQWDVSGLWIQIKAECSSVWVSIGLDSVYQINIVDDLRKCSGCMIHLPASSHLLWWCFQLAKEIVTFLGKKKVLSFATFWKKSSFEFACEMVNPNVTDISV
ncbi:unnamed protein product [Ilex paraguariensis]|uniref:Reverse transcriptase zinc-binding domain-containing protein n=1 Tax=Ilex paraguariensis TaxID=185542 RepID=A0ABC8QYN8_9AQUA